MPKLGMEPKRRAALVSAVIDEIGETRSIDVTVAKIARRAGMSSGLAHHYFGSKEQMLIAAMRFILAEFSADVRAELAKAKDPRGRLEAIIRANFAAHVFDRRKMSAWLSFYALAQSNPQAAHLMKLYQRRLHSNLMYDLRALTPDASAVATKLAALIDGVYLRAALNVMGDRKEAAQQVSEALESFLNAKD
ncbi:transcriptional regulator BetI [Tritonibacter mobilis]|nr:transcriptional regulator BetI [Tritonibacter mobilis]